MNYSCIYNVQKCTISFPYVAQLTKYPLVLIYFFNSTVYIIYIYITAMYWFAVTIWTEGPQTMNPTNIGDPQMPVTSL